MQQLKSFLHEFFIFGFKEARSCVFAGSFFVVLFLSNHIPLFGLPRYDFLLIAALVIQVILVATKLETWDEVKVIFLFHIIGFILELYKTQPWVGSWSYPEFAYTKVFTVPLFSGFMYSAIGSYMSQSWNIFKLHVVKYPPYWQTIIVAALIYINFFTNRFLYDFRWWIVALLIFIFWRTHIEFTVIQKIRRMPLLVSFVLIGFFVWIAENISTFWGAWQYPEQIHAWSMVELGKISSWALLVILSFILVADLKQFKRKRLTK